MKKLILIFFLSFVYIFGYSQTPSTIYIEPTVAAMQAYFGYANRIYVVADTADYVLCQSCTVDDSLVFAGVGGRKWLRLVKNLSNIGSIIPAGAITTIPVVGTNPGTNLSSSDWIINTFYGNQPPTASLSGGGIFEYTSASTASETLNWGAGRQSATQPLQSIVVAGNTESFSQPSAPGTTSGTQGVTITTNTNTTYSNEVTTTDSKTATASTTFTYESKYYIGYVSSTTPSDADIIAALGTTAGGTFATSRLTNGTLPDPASSSYIIFAYPASFGAATIKIQGLTVAYNLTTRSFTNSSGFSTSYNIYISPFQTAGGAAYQVL